MNNQQPERIFRMDTLRAQEPGADFGARPNILRFFATAVAAFYLGPNAHAAEVWVAENGDDTNAGTEEAPFQTIQKAAAGRVAGDVINVTPGTYAHFTLAPLSIENRAITIQSTDGADVTFIEGGAHNRAATLATSYEEARNAILRGFTLRNGNATQNTPNGANGGGVYGGNMYDCVVSNNTAVAGGGVAVANVHNSIVTGNTAEWYGGGLFNCTWVEGTVVSNNTAIGQGVSTFYYARGGGAYGCAMITNCVIAANTAGSPGGAGGNGSANDYNGDGGGVYSTEAAALVTHSRITGNKALFAGSGGGTCGATVRWSTLSGNTAANGGGAYGGRIYNSHITGNTATNRGGGYYDNTKLLSLENCVIARNTASMGGGVYGRGTTTGLSADIRTYNCTIVYNTLSGAGGSAGVYEGTHYNGIIYGNTNADGGVADNYDGTVSSSRVGVDPSFMDAANDNFRLRADSVCLDYTTVNLPTTLLDLDGNPRLYGYNSLDSLPQMDQGAYEKNRIDCPPVLYVSANDPAADDENDGGTPETPMKTIQVAINAVADNGTIIVADGVYGKFNSRNREIRIESVNGAEFTLVNGDAGSTAADNRPATLGQRAGANNTVLVGFTLQNGNVGTGANRFGGGAMGGRLEDCVILNNTARDGGGAWNSILVRCAVAGNVAGNQGGGSFGGEAWHSEYDGNNGSEGGGVHATTLYNCLVQNNHAVYYGGGANNAWTYNSTIVHNSVNFHGSGGVNGGTHYNAIIFYNTRLSPANTMANWYAGSRYGCHTTAAGESNETDPGPNPPGFVNPAKNGDFRLLADSPCVDKGSNHAVAWDTDLDGKQRIYNSTVDIGAYECDSFVETHGTVSFYLDEASYAGSDAWDVKIFAYGEPCVFPKAPVSDEYAFLGWFDAETGVEAVDGMVFTTASPTALIARWGEIVEEVEIAIVIVAFEIVKDEDGAEWVRLKVATLDETDNDRAVFNISIVGTPDLGLPFTQDIPTYDTRLDQQATPLRLKREGCEFSFPKPEGGTYFFRATSTQAR